MITIFSNLYNISYLLGKNLPWKHFGLAEGVWKSTLAISWNFFASNISRPTWFVSSPPNSIDANTTPSSSSWNKKYGLNKRIRCRHTGHLLRRNNYFGVAWMGVKSEQRNYKWNRSSLYLVDDVIFGTTFIFYCEHKSCNEIDP